MSSSEQVVYVLHYWHKHGDDYSVYATEELAREAVAEIARESWGDMARSIHAPEGTPESAEGLSGAEAARIYFDVMEAQEGYEISVQPVIGA